MRKISLARQQKERVPQRRAAGPCRETVQAGEWARGPMARRQAGQAVVEALLTLTVLAGLWVAIPWLGRLQDTALQLGHASRRLAFAQAHQGVSPQTADAREAALGLSAYSSGPGHHWRTRTGGWLLKVEEGTDRPAFMLEGSRQTAMPPMQAGDPLSLAPELRRDWQLGDERVWRARAWTGTAGVEQPSDSLQSFDDRSLTLARHTAILVGDGSADSDAGVHATLGRSAVAWATAAGRSVAAGQVVARRAAALDEAWHRPSVSWDWLGAWAGWVPRRHLDVMGKP